MAASSALQRQLDRFALLGGEVGGENDLVGFYGVVEIGKDRGAVEDAGGEGFDLAVEGVMRDVAAVRKNRRDRGPVGLAGGERLAPEAVVANRPGCADDIDGELVRHL